MVTKSSELRIVKEEIKKWKEIKSGTDKDGIPINIYRVKIKADVKEENSIKKAKALAEKTEYMVLADDSGLFVDILNGEPGVRTARYGGVHDYELTNRMILDKMNNKINRYCTNNSERINE
jgi:XTP/dITP diphosphohydrolase